VALNVKAKVKSMDEKKAQNQDAVLGSKAINFFGDIKSEFKKISWTSRDELRVYTKIVVGATFAFGMLVYIADLFIQRCLLGLDGFFRLITG